MNEKLSYKEAFVSMTCFLEHYYHRTNSDDVGSLLGDLMLLQDETTADPAAWQDWLKCIKIVKEENK